MEKAREELLEKDHDQIIPDNADFFCLRLSGAVPVFKSQIVRPITCFESCRGHVAPVLQFFNERWVNIKRA